MMCGCLHSVLDYLYLRHKIKWHICWALGYVNTWVYSLINHPSDLHSMSIKCLNEYNCLLLDMNVKLNYVSILYDRNLCTKSSLQ